MSEFIREVDEEFRHDQIRTFLNRYKVLIGALLVLILAGVGGVRAYMSITQQKAEAAGARFLDATDLARNDQAAALSGLDGLAKDGPAGYRLLARFRAAGLQGKSDADAGAKAFDALADDGAIDADLREIARLRAAMLLMDKADAAELHRRLDPLADANGTYRNVAREMLAVLALRSGDTEAARKLLDAILADVTAVPDQRRRATLYLGLIRSGPVPAVKP